MGKRLPSNRRAEACRAQAFVPNRPPLFSLEEKVPPCPRPLDWEPMWKRISNRALDPQSLLDSPLRGERLRLRPIWNPPVQVDPETAVQQLPGGPGTGFSPPTGKRPNDSPRFRLLKKRGCPNLIPPHPSPEVPSRRVVISAPPTPFLVASLSSLPSFEVGIRMCFVV